jgi:hypothetical protein
MKARWLTMKGKILDALPLALFCLPVVASIILTIAVVMGK